MPNEEIDVVSEQTYTCPLCGGEMLKLAHCKVRCPNCGMTEDCSDLFEGSARARSNVAAPKQPAEPEASPSDRFDAAPATPVTWNPALN
jgi:uncharacterized Zn finger protein (UPF0148 family)